jgi:very-short-patch-repair endonuclease
LKLAAYPQGAGLGNRPQHDNERDVWLKKYRVKVVRIPVKEVIQNNDEIADAIVRMATEMR